jgi:hypothetical protein
MKKIFGLFILLICLSSHSQDVAATNNAIKMGYNFVTVSQNVVFNSSMQSGGTLTFTADAMDGGGRTPGDPFTMKLVFYNSNNAIVNTVQQAHTLTYGATTTTAYTITATNCGGSCTNVAYVSVQFYGKDGGYWAGNYGPYVTNPSLTFNGGSNILYNPEFGVYGTNGFAQGWTSDNGWQSCALYSGAQTCVVNNNAPVNGGNYSATGGSTSGSAGGYSATPPPPPPPTPVYGSSITNAQQTRKNAGLIETTGHNAGVNIFGDDNIVTIQQIGSNGHFATVDISGNINNVNVLQTSTVGGRHYLEATVVGGNNNLILQQRETAKTQFVEVTGNHNSVTTNQKGSGNHYLDLSVTGNNHTAGVVQDGVGNHAATVKLDGTQPWNFQLNQNGSTNKTYSLPHTMSDGTGVNGTCNAIGGCNLIVNQQ